jgi:hypothetical protein
VDGAGHERLLLLALIAIGLSVMASRWLQQQRRQHV